MALSEFTLIDRYFKKKISRDDVLLGVGDDGALVRVPENQALVITVDTLVSGIHFLEDWDVQDIAYRSLAINLSDLAAMGAEPAWATLALTLPKAEPTWLEHFAQGFFALADHYRVELIGGDITHGPLSITIQAHGFVPFNQAIRRSGAKPGDLIFVTGQLAGASLALNALKGKKECSPQDLNIILPRLLKPQARVPEGMALRGLATSMIDISDGLSADLNHILEASHVGAVLELAEIPVHPLVKKYLGDSESLQLALSHGDDYELCFTIPPHLEEKVNEVMRQFDCGIKKIGVIEQELGLRALRETGKIEKLPITGYLHFV